LPPASGNLNDTPVVVDSFRWLTNVLGRIIHFWTEWWFTTVAVMIAAFAADCTDLSPGSWRGIGIIALLFFSGGYGTVMLIRCTWREIERPSLDE
jgi:hypothetical protein